MRYEFRIKERGKAWEDISPLDVTTLETGLDTQDDDILAERVAVALSDLNGNREVRWNRASSYQGHYVISNPQVRA